MQFSSVVFPAPFGPTTASTSPARTSSEIPLSALTPPKLALRSVSSITGSSLATGDANRPARSNPAETVWSMSGDSHVPGREQFVPLEPLGRSLVQNPALRQQIAVARDLERESRPLFLDHLRGA